MLQRAARAPININAIPSAQPFNAKTYGKDSTPEPIAHAQSEKMEPLTLPFPTLEKVLLKNVLLISPCGDKTSNDGITSSSGLTFWVPDELPVVFVSLS